MKAVLYARYSPRPVKGKEPMSCEVQLDKCRKECELGGHEIVAEERDNNKSGKSTDNRPGFKTAMEKACKKKHCLVVYSLSRLARRSRDAIDACERLQAAGAQLILVKERIDTSTAVGRAFYQIMAAFAELERETTSERTSDAMQFQQANGFTMSKRLPYGFRFDPDSKPRKGKKIPARMVEDPVEQDNIRLICQLHADGLTYRAICRKMGELGRPCRGKEWRHGLVSSIVKRGRGK